MVELVLVYQETVSTMKCAAVPQISVVHDVKIVQLKNALMVAHAFMIRMFTNVLVLMVFQGKLLLQTLNLKSLYRLWTLILQKLN
jgi:hypothetical protein